jgi:hypothetical protein
MLFYVVKSTACCTFTDRSSDRGDGTVREGSGFKCWRDLAECQPNMAHSPRIRTIRTHRTSIRDTGIALCMAAPSSDDLVDISTKDLEAWLEEQEEEARSLRRRLEENELVTRELQKIIAERNDQIATTSDAEGTENDDNPMRALKRSLVRYYPFLKMCFVLII